MKVVKVDELPLFCSYNGTCCGDNEKCKMCGDYVVSFEEIQNRVFEIPDKECE